MSERDEQNSSDEQFKQDGYKGYLSGIKSGFTDRKTFTHLITIWKDWCQTGEYKAPVKIAIVDTGLDLNNRDFERPRVEAFIKGKSGNLEARLAKDDNAAQVSRVKGRLNLAKGIRKDKLDIHDLDGHATRVAGIIMRLAPDADLYIACVCDGNVGSAEAQVQPAQKDAISAIDWAIENKVDIINLSLGFRESSPQFSGILQKAKTSGILIMAAMPNTGNYGCGEPSWPASDFSTTIGIHSCKPGGTFPSEFTSPPAAGNPNFMVAGEAIIVHMFPYPTGIRSPSVAERFELAAGTSYATAIATSMVSLVLSFIRQGNCEGLRRKARRDGLDVFALLKGHYKMAAVLKEVARPTIGNYSWISPELLWMGFQPPVGGNGISKAGRKYAWNIIYKALH